MKNLFLKEKMHKKLFYMHELKLQLNFTYCTYENVKKHEKIMMSFTMYHLKLILSQDLENVLQFQKKCFFQGNQLSFSIKNTFISEKFLLSKVVTQWTYFWGSNKLVGKNCE